MARVTVTVADFRTQFPEFAATSDGMIEMALEEGLLLHSVRKLATLYASAHVLAFRLPTQGTTPINGGGGSTVVSGQVTRRRVGPLEEEFSTHTGTASAAGGTRKSAEDLAYFSSTVYGQHFLALEGRSARATIGALVV